MLNEPNDNSTKFVKADENKPEWCLIPPDAIEEIVNVLTYGARKYSPNNWHAGAAYCSYLLTRSATSVGMTDND